MKHVYSLEDLSSPEFRQSMPNAKLAVIGWPIKHSASPQMHQAALDQAGIDLQYIRAEVAPGEVARCFEIMQNLGFLGCNVTVPHKIKAMQLCDERSDDAICLGATNTIKFESGKRYGHNTDGPGLARAIEEDFGKNLSELKVLILGAGGGAGRAIATQCARLGSPSLYLSNRTVSKVETLAENLTKGYGATNTHAIDNSSEALMQAASNVNLIINSTSLGLKPEDPLPLPIEALDSKPMVYDAIYNPAVTPLLAAAQEKQCATANGLSMLLHQGALAFEYWLNTPADIPSMRSGLNL